MRKLKIYHMTFVVIISLGFIITAQNSKIPAEDLLKLRNLQFEQAKRVVRMQDLRTEFDKINNENEQLKVQIEAWIKEQAQKQSIDLTKFYFDSDQLKFVEIKKNEKQTTN